MATAIDRANGASHGLAALRTPLLEIDRAAREVLVSGREVALTRLEFALLDALAERPSAILSKERPLRDVWGYRTLGRTRTVDSHACRLRKKLGDERLVHSVRGAGYRLVARQDADMVVVGERPLPRAEGAEDRPAGGSRARARRRPAARAGRRRAGDPARRALARARPKGERGGADRVGPRRRPGARRSAPRRRRDGVGQPRPGRAGERRADRRRSRWRGGPKVTRLPGTARRGGPGRGQPGGARARRRAHIAQAVGSLRSSEGFRAWLTAAKRFHRYTLLISMTGVIDPV